MSGRGIKLPSSRFGERHLRLVLHSDDPIPLYPLLHMQPTAEPSITPVAGDMYFDSTANTLMFYNGAGWSRYGDDTFLDARNYVADFTVAETSWPTLWTAIIAAADAEGLPILIAGTTPYKLDLNPSVSANRIPVTPGTIMRGNGQSIIRVYNGDSLVQDGSGFLVDTSNEDYAGNFYEYLTFEGENGSDWGNAYAYASTYQTMVLRFISNDADNELRHFGARFNYFKHLDGEPLQVIGTDGHAFGGYFDFNTIYQCSRSMNGSAPYSSVAFNKFEQAQVSEFAAPCMVVVGNIARKHRGNFSIGASGQTTAEYYGDIVALNSMDEQSGAESFVIGTTDGAPLALIVGNFVRRAWARALLLGSAATDYHAERSRVIGLIAMSCGNVAAGGTRAALHVTEDYADVDLSTVYNEPADAGVWEAQTGLLIQANYGAYDRNRLDGTSNHVQFDGTGTNNKAIGTYWGAGNLYDPAKVSFIRAPTGASYFLDGSVMRFNRNGVTGQLPTAAEAYRGLTALVQDDISGKGDAQFKCVETPAGTWVWQAIGDPVARAVTNAGLTATRYDRLLLCTTGASDRTITLPAAASSEGVTIKAIKIDAGAGKVILDGNSSENINGATTYDITTQYEYAQVYCNGTEWFVIGND